MENQSQQQTPPQFTTQKKFYKKWWFWVIMPLGGILIAFGVFAFGVYFVCSDCDFEQSWCELWGKAPYSYNCDDNENLWLRECSVKCISRPSDAGEACYEGSDCTSGVCYTSYEKKSEDWEPKTDDQDYLIGHCAYNHVIKDCPKGENCIFGVALETCYIPQKVTLEEFDEVVICNEDN